jgi:hypothetical protein
MPLFPLGLLSQGGGGNAPGPWWYAIITDTTTPSQFWDTDLAADTDGNAYYIYSSTGGGVQEPKLFKISNSGIVTWARRFFGSTWSQNSTNVTYEQGKALVSGVNGTGSIQYNWAQTLNSDGTSTAVSRSVGIPGYYNATSQHSVTTIDASNNIYSVGAFFTGSDYNDFIVQYTAAGAIGWQRFWTGNGLRTSAKWQNNSLYFHRFNNLYKLNSSGTLINSRGIVPSAGSILSFGLKFGVDTSENQYRAGGQYSNFATLFKFDSDLLVTWGKSFTSVSGLSPYNTGAVVDSSGNGYFFYHAGGQQKSLWVVKTNSAGTILWTRSFAFRISGSYPYIYKAVVASYANGDLILTVNQDTTTNRPQIIVKLPADGTKTGTYTTGAYSFDWVAETPTFSTLTATYNTPAGPNTGSGSAGAGVPSNSAWTSYAITKTDIPA